jgi:toxin ParE1/3/4
MNGNVDYRDGARQDLIDIYRRLAREAGIRTADRFIASAEASFLRLAAMPGLGTRFELDNAIIGELRFLPLPSRFKKYLVFYRPVADGIEIARVLHGARDIHGILSEEFDPVADAGDEAEDVNE